MYILKQFQEDAVKDLLKHTFSALKSQHNQEKILLEAPTGAGKTVMMASYLERLIEELHLRPGVNGDTAFIWFAPNTLHIQSFLSLQKQYADSSKLNCIDLSFLTGNPVLNPKDLLFINWSSVDSMNNLWRKENESNTNLQTLIENTKLNDTQIILIIDEAHLAAFSGPQAIEVRNLIKAKVEVMVTATPLPNRPPKTVSIPREDVVAEQMIKKSVRLNIGLDPADQNGDNVHIHLLRTAIAKKQQLQAQYDAELGIGVLNPLLLIQLPSDNANLSAEDESIRDVLVSLLSKEFNITTGNGRLAIWLSGEKIKDCLEEMNAMQDVLIFKQAIAQGWDCPRASILVSYRTVRSENFGIQTVGRILRMPHQRHYECDDLNYGYVYTNLQTSSITLVANDADYISLQIANRQANKGWVFNKLATTSIVNDRPPSGVLSTEFEIQFFEVMQTRYTIHQLPDIDLFTAAQEADLSAQKAFNKLAMMQAGWEFNIDDHQIPIATDIEIDPYEMNTIVFNDEQIQKFSITNAQFGEMFERLCFENITRLNRSKSWKKLRDTLLHFAEYYLGIFEFEARKLFLYPQNKTLLIAHIAITLENFEVQQQYISKENSRVVKGEWQVPPIRYYSDLYKEDAVKTHALEPFLESQHASSPEISFKKFLITHAADLDWWYKNGDQGKEHFAVPYTNLQNELRLFYVDFVIKLKGGKIALFDTKTKRSDLEAPQKHNALLAYIQNENDTNKDRVLVGGILIPDEIGGIISFRYPVNDIVDTNDLAGWQFLNLADLNVE